MMELQELVVSIQQIKASSSELSGMAVSYTHLTLPTLLRV